VELCRGRPKKYHRGTVFLKQRGASRIICNFPGTREELIKNSGTRDDYFKGLAPLDAVRVPCLQGGLGVAFWGGGGGGVVGELGGGGGVGGGEGAVGGVETRGGGVGVSRGGGRGGWGEPGVFQRGLNGRCGVV